MEIVPEDYQNLAGLSKNAIDLINSIRILAQSKLPNKVPTHVEVKRSEMLDQNKTGDILNFYKIHHKMFNKYFSIKIFLMVEAVQFNDKILRHLSDIFRLKKDCNNIIFALKNGVKQEFTLHEDIDVVDDFLTRNKLYKKLIDSIEKDLFNSL